MTLKVIGSGLGRTGTKSLKTALAMLGLGPCHHMVEVFAKPETMGLWVEAAAGRPDWDEIFKDFNSAVDYPGAVHWRELAAYYPDAKILHTVRDPNAWFESIQATIFAPTSIAMQEITSGKGVRADFFRSFTAALQGHFHDRDYLIDYFRRHTEEVKEAIPPERLLIYEAAQGWAPLCAFLGVAVPDAPYPAENNRAEFIARAAAMTAAAPAK